MVQWVELNSKLTRAAQARVPVTDLGLLYGIGLFETMRAYGGRVFRLQQHFDRLMRSAATLQLPITQAMLPDAPRVQDLLKANRLDDARVRLTITGGAPLQDALEHTVLMTAVPLEAYPEAYYRQGISVQISAQLQPSRDPLAGHKTLSYWPRLQALHQAQLQGCGEVLWFTDKRELAEGAISNVFVVKGGTVQTPPWDTPVLPGITRAAVLELCASDQIPCRETTLLIDDLLDADEVFVCNAMMEIVPVCHVERKAIGNAQVGAITMQLSRAYSELVAREC